MTKEMKANLPKGEFKARKELRSDRDHTILTADKGVALVVMDKSDYIKKMKELLEDTNIQASKHEPYHQTEQIDQHAQKD